MYLDVRTSVVYCIEKCHARINDPAEHRPPAAVIYIV